MFQKYTVGRKFNVEKEIWYLVYCMYLIFIDREAREIIHSWHLVASVHPSICVFAIKSCAQRSGAFNKPLNQVAFAVRITQHSIRLLIWIHSNFGLILRQYCSQLQSILFFYPWGSSQYRVPEEAIMWAIPALLRGRSDHMWRTSRENRP